MVDPITDSMIAGDLDACGDRATAALQSGVSDFRVISGFLLGIFNQRGPEALPEIADVLGDILAKHWHTVRPEGHKDRVVDSSLVLFFRVLRSSVEFHESQRDQDWQRWAMTMPADLGERSTSAFRKLSATIAATIGKPRSAGELERLSARAESLFRPKPASAGETASEVQVLADASVVGNEPSSAPPLPDEPALASGEPDPSGAAGMTVADTMPSSPQFQLLLRKLAAFETLVARAQMAKAAIVAADLRELIDHFDPRVYFPAVFAPHFRLLSEHIEDIAPHWNRTADPVWQARQQLYGVDLDAFLDSK